VLLSDMLSKQVALAVAGLWPASYELALLYSPTTPELANYAGARRYSGEHPMLGAFP